MRNNIAMIIITKTTLLVAFCSNTIQEVSYASNDKLPAVEASPKPTLLVQFVIANQLKVELEHMSIQVDLVEIIQFFKWGYEHD